jgi:hypothetical protein
MMVLHSYGSAKVFTIGLTGQKCSFCLNDNVFKFYEQVTGQDRIKSMIKR